MSVGAGRGYAVVVLMIVGESVASIGSSSGANG